jgi:hypothetical protein
VQRVDSTDATPSREELSSEIRPELQVRTEGNLHKDVEILPRVSVGIVGTKLVLTDAEYEAMGTLSTRRDAKELGGCQCAIQLAAARGPDQHVHISFDSWSARRVAKHDPVDMGIVERLECPAPRDTRRAQRHDDRATGGGGMRRVDAAVTAGAFSSLRRSSIPGFLPEKRE